MINNYLKNIGETTLQGDAREESYYSPLSELFLKYSESIGKKKIHITTLPKKTEAGNPDFRIWDGAQHIIGYIEAKVPGSDLDKIEVSEQLKRYRDTFPNLILTDFYEFRLYRDGKLIDKIKIGRLFIAKKLSLVPPLEKEVEFKNLLDKFYSFSIPRVYSAESLAIELAKRTRFLKEEVIHKELEDEDNSSNQVTGFYEAFQKYLINGLTKEDFADLYSQTIAYGLFAARTRTDGVFNRRNAYNFIPPTIGILRDVFQFISLGSLPLQMEVIIDDIAQVLNAADINKILIEYKKTRKGEDPIIHFYETFLNKYDPTTRERRGVYYTPEPVVNYIVKSVNQILITDFQKENGFANTDVTVLDPAGGTLTFLAQTAKIAINDFTKKYGVGQTNIFIRDHVLTNFYAFELMMAPYAIAHLKMSFLLEEFGYKMKDKDRFKLYLTNTLEVEELEQTRIPGMASLAEESKQANLIKNKQQILAIMGNPPYSVASYNKSKFIEDIMDLYKQDVKDEKNIQLLSDDYAKFIRFCHWKIEQAGKGVIGLITKNTYLNTSAFKGLRKKLLEEFDKVYVLNLHGKLYEKSPSGCKDQNVFDIRVGTAILFLVKTSHKQKGEIGHLYFKEIYGDRNHKYDYLETYNITTTDWEELKVNTNYYFFEKKSFNEPELYDSFWPIDDIFKISNTGVETGRDHFIIGDSQRELEVRLNNFISCNFPIDLIRTTFDLNDQPNFKLEKVKANFKKIASEKFELYNHKPFYNRVIYYDNIFLRRHSGVVMSHLKQARPNLSLILKKRSTDTNYSNCFCSDKIIDRNFLGGQSYVFPVWLYDDKGGLFGASKSSNINPDIEKLLENQYSQKGITNLIFYYIYAILYSNNYRDSFAEQLQINYPKIPFTRDYNLFKQVSDIGKELVDLHLLKSIELSNPAIKFYGSGDYKVTSINLKENDLYINDSQYFNGVTIEIWDWEVGKNKPLQRWIKNTKNKILDLNQTIEFCKISSAVKLTFEKQNKIDSLYDSIIESIIEK